MLQEVFCDSIEAPIDLTVHQLLLTEQTTVTKYTWHNHDSSILRVFIDFYY